MSDGTERDPMVASVISLIATHRGQLDLSVQATLTGTLAGAFAALAEVYGDTEVRAAFLTIAMGGEMDPRLYEIDLRQCKPAGEA